MDDSSPSDCESGTFPWNVTCGKNKEGHYMTQKECLISSPLATSKLMLNPMNKTELITQTFNLGIQNGLSKRLSKF